MGMNKVTIEVEARFTDHVTGSTKNAEKAINDMGKALDEAQESLDGINRSKVKPSIDAEDDSFARKVQGAEERARRLGQTQANVVLGATDHASETIGQAQGKARSFADRVYSAVINVKDSTAYQAISKIKSGLETIANTAWTATVKIKDFATAPLRKVKDSLFNVKTLAATVMGGMIANKFVKGPVQQYADYEDLVTQFGVLLGSQEAAEQRMADLVKFAGQTPFTRDEIFQASRVLQTYTGGALATPDATGGLKMIGDVAAGTGQSYERVANYFGRLYNEVARGGKSLGEPLMMLREIGALSAENEEAIKAIAEGSGTIDEKWAKIAQQFSKTDGMMEAMSNQMNNLLLGVKSFIKNNLWMRLGKGISESLKPFLADFRTWRNENSELISGWADRIQEFAKVVSGKALDGVRNLAKRADELFRSDAFKEASLSGKIRMTWDTLVADPLSEWWEHGGRDKTAAAAQRIGNAAGGMLSGAILGILGFTNLATEVGADGGSVANAFVQGFLAGFDGDAIKTAIKETVSDVWGTFKESSLGGKIVTAAILAKLSNKYLGPLFKLGGGLFKLGGGLIGKLIKWAWGRRKGGADGGVLGGLSQSVGTMHVSAGVVYVSGPTIGGMPGTGGGGGILKRIRKALPAGSAAAPLALPGEVAAGEVAGAAGEVAGAAGTTGGLLSRAGSILGKVGPIASGIFAGITAIKGGQEIYRGQQDIDKGDTLHGYTQQGKGYTKLGTVTAGAALGSIVPGVGTAIGAGLGALAGWGLGPVMDKSEKLAEHAKQTHKAIKDSIWDAKTLGRAFEENPLYDDGAILRFQNALERMKYKARTGEYADVYKEPTLGERIKTFFTGPHETQNRGRQFETTTERPKPSPRDNRRRYHSENGEWGPTSPTRATSHGTSYQAQNKGRQMEVPVSLTYKEAPGATSNIIDFVEKAKERLGSTGAVQPEVDVEPTYRLTTMGEDLASEILDRVPDSLNMSTTVTDSVSPLITGTEGITATILGKVPDTLTKSTGLTDNVTTTVTGISGIAEKIKSKVPSTVTASTTLTVNVATNIAGNIAGAVNSYAQSQGYARRGRGFRGGIVGGPSATEAYARGGLVGYSDGGIVRGGSRLIQVAEEGSPEMVIPLSSQRRDRGRKLWEKAGEMLKVPGFAQGGLTDGSNVERIRPYTASVAPVSPGETHVEVGGITVQLTVQAAPGGSVVDEVRSRKDELVEAVAGAIADALEGGFANTPLRGGLAG